MSRPVLTLDDIDMNLIVQALHERACEYKRREYRLRGVDGDVAEDQVQHCRIRSEQCGRLVGLLSAMQAPVKIAGRP